MTKDKTIGYAVQIGDGFVSSAQEPSWKIGADSLVPPAINISTTDIKVYGQGLFDYEQVKKIADHYNGQAVVIYAKAVEQEEVKKG